MLKRLLLLTFTLGAICTWNSATVLMAQETAPAPAIEQILSYDSDITVNPDGTLLVRETLTVFAMGAQIKHGIYRDFPLHFFYDHFSNPYFLHFVVVSAERDGQPEDYHLEKLSNGLRLHLGKGSELVPPGQHTYELTYTVDREIGFFPDHDELIWNVTGGRWIFPIQKVSATVHLPKGIAQQAILLDAYTGLQDLVGTDYAASADGQSNATFRTTRALGPAERLIVVTRWPKGFVHPPTADQEYRYFLEDYQATLIGLMGLIVTLIYYAAVWLHVGRESAQGEIEPISEPPRGFSPAALRYMWRRAFDQKTLVANLVALAIKKQLAILEDGSGGYILGRLKPDAEPASSQRGSNAILTPEITPDEKLILDKLFAAEDTIRLEPTHHALVGGTIEALHQHLRCKLEKFNFMTTSRYLVPGLLISLATVVRCGFTIQGGQRLVVLFLTIGLLVWSLGFLVVASMAIAAGRNALSDPHHAPTARKHAMGMGAICLALFLGVVVGLDVMAWAASTGVAIVLMLLVTINYVFYNFLKASARSGRALMDEIECFRMFLVSTEKGRRDARTPPKITPPMFERLLPYAMALNVEKVWGEKFAAALAQTAKDGKVAYSPRWYSGPGWDPITVATFATSLGNAFSSAISLSTTAPSPNSGGSGSAGSGGN